MKVLYYFLLLCGILVLISAPVEAQVPISKHFKLIKLSDGVYAAIASEKGYAICNAGIVDLGDATVVIDPFMTPEAAEDLKTACSVLCKNPVKYVINTHDHNDHVGGNQVFDGATIISTGITRNEMATKLPAEMSEDKELVPQKLEQVYRADTASMSSFDRKEWSLRKYYLEGLVKSFAQVKISLPTLCFDHELQLHGTLRNIQLSCWGAGHTQQDLIVFLPTEGIIFTGDLVFNTFHPWLSDGDVSKWADYLDKISNLPIRTLIPGHGPPGDLSTIHLMKRYFQAVDSIASYCQQKKLAPTSVNRDNFPEPFKEWYLSGFIKPNMLYAFNRKYKK